MNKVLGFSLSMSSRGINSSMQMSGIMVKTSRSGCSICRFVPDKHSVDPCPVQTACNPSRWFPRRAFAQWEKLPDFAIVTTRRFGHIRLAMPLTPFGSSLRSSAALVGFALIHLFNSCRMSSSMSTVVPILPSCMSAQRESQFFSTNLKKA